MSGPPGYEVGIRPVGGRRRHLILPLVAAIAFVGVALGTSLLTSPPRPPAPPPPRQVSVECGALDAYNCGEAVDAARLAIADVPAAVDAAQAWPGLICGDNFDCPPPLLAASHPVGSVVLTLADRGVVWVNVFRVPRPNRLDENGEAVEARVVRWFRAPA